MVAALVGAEHDAARQTCGYCDAKVYDVRFYPVRPEKPFRDTAAFCAICGRSEREIGDRCLRASAYPMSEPEAVAKFDARHRKAPTP